MQASGSGHASRASELTAGLVAFCTGSVGLTAANSTGGVADCDIGGGSDKAALPLLVSATSTEPVPSLASFRSGSDVLNDGIATGTAAGRGIGGGSDKVALPLAIPATETPRPPGAVVRGASTCSGGADADIARPTLGAPVLSSRTNRGQRARPRPNWRERPFRTTPLIQQVAAASSPPSPLKFIRKAMADFKVQSMATSNPTGPRRVAHADNPGKLGAHTSGKPRRAA